MSNLYQDAILDAKALRASAMANAKAALEEAFEPKIQEMLSKKLAEEAGEVDEEIEEALDMKDEAKVEEAEMHDKAEMEESADINEAELEEILNQLEEMESHDETLKEAEEGEKEEEEGEEEEEDEAEEGEAEEAGEAAADEELVDDETKVIDITLGDLKQVLQSVMGGQAELGAEMPAEEPNADSEAEAEIDLDEILGELEAEGAGDVGHYDAADVQAADTQGAEDFGMNEAVDMGTVAAGLASVLATTGGIVGLQAYLKKKYPKAAAALEKLGSAAGESTGTMGRNEAKHELEEAKSTIETLRKDLQEVNLLNAKYLYMNKLFKSKSLNETQKMKVVNALDRATTVTEVKNTYETLKESFETKKQQIKESIGFASKPAGVAPKANIMEADQFISRWQKIAGIKK